MTDMSHDILCEMHKTGCRCTWVPFYGKSCDLCYCLCDEIRAARADERQRILGTPPPTPPLPSPESHGRHDPLCVEGLSPSMVEEIETQIPLDECDYCRIISKAETRGYSKAIDELSWECDDCGNEYGPDVDYCPNKLRESVRYQPQEK